MICSRRRVATASVAFASVLIPAGLVWACVGVVSLTTASPTVQPGGTLTLTGREFAQAVPITIRLDSPTGPVLATVPAPASTMNSSWTATVTVPSDVANGRHFLVATQDHHNMNSGAPARSAFYVGTAAPVTTLPARPTALAASQGPGGASLVLIALGVAAAGLLAAGLWTIAAGRSGSSGRGTGAAGLGA